MTVLHNLEELCTVRAALAQPPLDTLLARWGVTPERAWSAFRLLNWSVSGAAAAAVIAGVSQRRPELPGITAATLLVNVAVPHVPAAVRAGGYAPGVVTAVTLVLPVTSRHLLRSYRDGLLSRRELRTCLQVGLALVALGVPLGLICADRLVIVGRHGRGTP